MHGKKNFVAGTNPGLEKYVALSHPFLAEEEAALTY